MSRYIVGGIGQSQSQPMGIAPHPQRAPGAVGLAIVSTGVVATEHMAKVNEQLRTGTYSSHPIFGKLSPEETDYFELTYQLFHDGMLKGVQVGLPFRVFMAALLGSPTSRLDEICSADPMVAHLRCPASPNREMPAVEYGQVRHKLERLEQAVLYLHEDVYNNARLPPPGPYPDSSGMDPSRAKRPRSSLSSAPPPTTTHSPRAQSPKGTNRIATTNDNKTNIHNGGLRAPEGVMAVQQHGPHAAGGRGAVSDGSTTAGAVPQIGPGLSPRSHYTEPDYHHPNSRPGTSALPSASTRANGSNPTTTTNNNTATSGSWVSSSTSHPQNANLPPPTKTFVDAKGRTHMYNEGQGVENLSRSDPGGAAQSRSGKRMDGPSMGRVVLGLGNLQQQTKSKSNKSGAGKGVKGQNQRNGRAGEDGARAEVSPAIGDSESEEAAAIEYLKWELHGKFMAFPGEDYHNLLAHLATEIYHYRYPVEHGVDILQGVIRTGAPEAVKACAVTLRHWNPPEAPST